VTASTLAEARGPRFDDILPIADAVLYEGYVLYPYRASSLKNQVRWTFGGVYPRAYSEAQTGADRCQATTECLVRGAHAELVIEARFLELLEQHAGSTREEAAPLSFRSEPGKLGALVGTCFECAVNRGRLRACLEVRAERLGSEIFRVQATLSNESDNLALDRSAALPDTLVAAHLLLGVSDGQFVSLQGPPAELSAAARACEQRGLWPVLAGKPGSLDKMLASPIILADYPEIAPESRADSCDATEIDEILLLRVLTLSEAEKCELRQGDPRARAILERAEALSGAELLRLHGRLRGPSPVSSAIAVGERVRLRPKARADIFDLALAGRVATVRAVERDFEDRVHLSVTVDDDPGADLGMAGFPGHRFFFFVDEVERLDAGGAS
jgi:hypothetical protein